jgi:phosphoribosylaminoimidazole-succinocarboxamide synthase
MTEPHAWDVRTDGPDEGSPDRPTSARLAFTDAYAVPEWGVMPDTVPGKGAAACTVAAHNADLLDTNHVPTNVRGVYPDVDPSPGTEPRELGACDAPPRALAVEVARDPGRDVDGSGEGTPDYEAYHAAGGDHYRLPVAVAVWTAVPPGAAVRHRATPGDLGVDPDALAVRSGTAEWSGGTGDGGRDDAWPAGLVELPEATVEFLARDGSRTLPREVAARAAGPAGLDRIEELALAVSHVVRREARKAGLGCSTVRIDLQYHAGTIEVAAPVGVPTGWQYTADGRPVSGTAVAPYYRQTHPEWVAAVETGTADEAPPLPATGVTALGDLYGSLLNAYTRWEWVDAPALEDALARIDAL